MPAIPIKNKKEMAQVGSVAANNDNEIGALIAEVVREIGTRGHCLTVSELVLGNDLQYIRINGTLVGALVGHAGDQLGLAVPHLGLHELQKEELVESQAAAATLGFAEAAGAVEPPQGFRESRQPLPRTDVVGPGLVVVGPNQHLVQIALEDPAEHPLWHLFGRRVRHEDGALLGIRVVLPGQHRELPRLDLAAVMVAKWPFWLIRC